MADNVNHGRLEALAAALELDDAGWQRALELAGLAPTPTDWAWYVPRFLIAVGAALVIAGIAAFFAWNWEDLHRLAKLALLQVGMLGAVLASWRLGLDTLPGRTTLFTAAFLVGLLLAVYGQVYQTGADPYGLFLTWALLVLPWTVIGRQAALWFLELVLVNLTVVLYWIQVLHPPDGWWMLAQLLGPLVWLGALLTDWKLASLVFAVDAAAIVAWELGASRGVPWLQSRWFPRLTALIALYTVLGPTLIMIFAAALDERTELSVLSPVLFALALAVTVWYYQFRKRDLLMLTLALSGAILVIMALAIEHLFSGFESTLMLAVLLMALVAGAARWLQTVGRRPAEQAA